MAFENEGRAASAIQVAVHVVVANGVVDGKERPVGQGCPGKSAKYFWAHW